MIMLKKVKKFNKIIRMLPKVKVKMIKVEKVKGKEINIIMKKKKSQDRLVNKIKKIISQSRLVELLK